MCPLSSGACALHAHSAATVFITVTRVTIFSGRVVQYCEGNPVILSRYSGNIVKVLCLSCQGSDQRLAAEQSVSAFDVPLRVNQFYSIE